MYSRIPQQIIKFHLGATKYILVLLHRKKLSNIVKMLGQGVFLPSEKRGGTQEIDLNDECVSITKKQVTTKLCNNLLPTLVIV